MLGAFTITSRTFRYSIFDRAAYALIDTRVRNGYARISSRSTRMLLVNIFATVLVQVIFVHSELFTSTTHLTQLLNTEIELSKQLEAYLKDEYARLDRTAKYVVTGP